MAEKIQYKVFNSRKELAVFAEANHINIIGITQGCWVLGIPVSDFTLFYKNVN